MSPEDAFTMEEKFKKVGISTRETDSSLSDAISSLSSASIFRKKNICVKAKIKHHAGRSTSPKIKVKRHDLSPLCIFFILYIIRKIKIKKVLTWLNLR